MMNRN